MRHAHAKYAGADQKLTQTFGDLWLRFGIRYVIGGIGGTAGATLELFPMLRRNYHINGLLVPHYYSVKINPYMFYLISYILETGFCPTVAEFLGLFYTVQCNLSQPLVASEYGVPVKNFRYGVANPAVFCTVTNIQGEHGDTLACKIMSSAVSTNMPLLLMRIYRCVITIVSIGLMRAGVPKDIRLIISRMIPEILWAYLRKIVDKSLE